MKRASLFYLSGYLIGGGVGLLLAPQLVLRLLLSNGAYGDVFPRMAGGLMVALGGFVAMLIRHHIVTLYGYAVTARLGLIAVMIWLFTRSRDPLFLTLTAVVGLGVALTAIGYAVDGRRPALAH